MVNRLPERKGNYLWFYTKQGNMNFKNIQVIHLSNKPVGRTIFLIAEPFSSQEFILSTGYNENSSMKKSVVSSKSIVPVMLAFFTMGFVDLVGIAANYVKQDFALSDTAANSFTVMVFFWFFVFSVPTGMLMNKIGRKNTVLLSMVVTFVGLLIPLLVYNDISMFFAFSFIGIGNTLMQVSLNPLLASLVSEERQPSYLTLGQFIKSVASFVAPLIAVHAAVQMGNWKLLFLIFAVIDVMAVFCLLFTPIVEVKAQNNSSTFKECILLLKNGVILLLFVGILVHVGIDVGVNISAPKLLQERVGLSLSEAGYATSVFFLFRTLGCFSGTIIMRNSHR